MPASASPSSSTPDPAPRISCGATKFYAIGLVSNTASSLKFLALLRVDQCIFTCSAGSCSCVCARASEFAIVSNNIFTPNAGRQVWLQAGSIRHHHGATTDHAGKFPCIMTLRLLGAKRLATNPRNCGMCGLTSASKGADKLTVIGRAGKVRSFRLAVLNHRRSDTCMHVHAHTHHIRRREQS